MTLGEVIKNYRESQSPKLSLGKLAEKADLSKAYLSMMENNKFPHGKNRPTDITIVKLARAMEMDVNDLVEYLDDDYPVIMNTDRKTVTKVFAPQETFDKAVEITIETELIEAFRELNEVGQEEAIKRVKELSYNPLYTSKNYSASRDTA